MSFHIEPLNSENMPLWLDFFDNRALKDVPDWDGCYCQAYLNTKEVEEQISASGIPYQKEFRRLACERLETKVMQGYVAIEDGKVIGWMACGPGANYPGYEEWQKSEPTTARIPCFTIDIDRRGQGIARSLLQYGLNDLATRGFKWVEAKGIHQGENNARNYPGPIKLYESFGFKALTKIDERSSLMVKEL